MKVLGIDPGIHGALALVNIIDGTASQLIDVLDVPVIGTGAKDASTRCWCGIGSPSINRITH
jgi:hypothetical protein